MDKTRIDQLLLAKNIVPSLAKAQALIMAGVVLVNEQRVDKPSEKFSSEDIIRIKGANDPENKYVSRAGLKLEAALKEFKIDVTGMTCLDVGSSTGGFTDCLLQHGAKEIYAVDVGTNQLDWKLRNDPRVKSFEGVNARQLDTLNFSSIFDIAVVDVSFISVKLIIPKVIPLLRSGAKLIVLIKPHFEAKKDSVPKGGIIDDPVQREKIVSDVIDFCLSSGLIFQSKMASPTKGREGNQEYLVEFYSARKQ